MWTTVKHYSLNWRAKEKRGYVLLRFEDATSERIEVSSLEELSALGDILRNEEPIRYQAVNQHLGMGWEPTGEAEA